MADAFDGNSVSWFYSGVRQAIARFRIGLVALLHAFAGCLKITMIDDM